MCHREALYIWLWSTCLPPIHPPASNHPIVWTEAMPCGFTLTCITSCMWTWAQFCRRGGQNNRNTSHWFPKHKSWSTHFMLDIRKHVAVRKDAGETYYTTKIYFSLSYYICLYLFFELSSYFPTSSPVPSSLICPLFIHACHILLPSSLTISHSPSFILFILLSFSLSTQPSI